jgi:regulatory protein
VSDIEDIIRKLEAYCAYQERCVFEVNNKLAEYDLSDKDKIRILASLHENKFLNEERFAEAYAQGKLHIKRWGKQKIKAGLIQKHVDAKIIKLALESLDEKEYDRALQSLYEKKSNELHNEKDPWNKKQKIMRYLASRGFTFEEISSVKNEE